MRARSVGMAAALAVAASLLVPGTAAAAPDDRCSWLPTAIRLARSIDGVTDQHAAEIQAALQRLGVTVDTPLPTGCGSTAPDPNAPLPAGGTKECEKFGSAPTPSGGYEVQNNVWGSDKPQCVRIFDTGFEVLDADHDDHGGVASYPSIWSGCWHGTCTAGTALPKPIDQLGTITTSWAVRIPDDQEKWNAAYDVWFSPTGNDEGADGTEMMIWLDHGDVAPIGEQTATVTLGGIEWQVWTGTNGPVKVISYVAVQGRREVTDLPLNDFMDDAIQRDMLGANWSLAAVQAGFEPWTKGAGLATTSFEVTGVTK
ncbi:GH12 family glycosyl hydrolase domain-containing protein [Pseudonocardia sp. CA-107938]|uniref:GH12 family glycosyl hydrolase domain-containing protein n=1 Tax=Pseudonocardia sp. CA-107938 TaxID=3240021 RepID=UPI003D933636